MLGAFIAFVLGSCFRWKVTYIFGDIKHTFGAACDELKTITVWDASATVIPPPIGVGFALLVTSCNHKVWEGVAQQGTWTTEKGSWVFIDPFQNDELSCLKKKAVDENVSDISKNFSIAGGVARLCVCSHPEVKSTIDAACDLYLQNEQLGNTIKKLVNNQDKVDVSGDYKKLYPGLTIHFYPTNVHRNNSVLAIASPYVEKRFKDAVRKGRESQMENTLRDLLGNPKSRGLAGNMWEPLFTKKMQTPNEKRTFIVVGCKLPTDKKSSPKLLVSEKTSTISHFDYKDSKELMTLILKTQKN